MSLDLLVTLYDVDSSKSKIDRSHVNKVYYSENMGLTHVGNYIKGMWIAPDQAYLN